MDIQNLTANALTVASAPPTKGSPVNTKVWADWLNLQSHDDPELEYMIRCCAEFALAMKAGMSPRWLTLMGGTGVGKTHCGNRLWSVFSKKFAWHAMDFIHKPVYWPKFIASLRSGSGYAQLEEMQRWPMLFIDDIGAERDTTGFAAEQLNTLLGCRMDRWTLITTNLYLKNLGEIDPRIADRAIRSPNIFCEVKAKSHSLRQFE